MEHREPHWRREGLCTEWWRIGEEGGCKERERDSLLTSTLQYTSVLHKRESTPWLPSTERASKRDGECCSPTSIWVSMALSLLHQNSLPQIAQTSQQVWFSDDKRFWLTLKRMEKSFLIKFWLKVWRVELFAVVKVGEDWILISIWPLWTDLTDIQIPHPQHSHFTGNVALKQKMAFSAVVWKRSNGGKLWACSQAFLSLLVGGRSAFGTARLPVWGQLNTAWDRALKACPARSQVLCVCLCVHVYMCVCVCAGASVCKALIKFDEPAMLRGPQRFQFQLL